MAERTAATAKVSEAKQTCSNSCKQKLDLYSSGLTADIILQLQRTAGNRAVQKLIKSGALQAKLGIRQPGNKYEQETDRVSEHMMLISEPVIQNKCDIVQQNDREHIIQRKEAISEPLHSSSHSKKMQKGTIGYRLDVVFHAGANRWVVTIDSTPVAEIAVKSKGTPLEVQVDIADNSARVIVRHYGDAALAPVAYERASLDLSISLLELDMRESSPDYTGSKEHVSGETTKGTVDIVILPPSALRWPDKPIGGVSVEPIGEMSTIPLIPRVLSEFEEKVHVSPNLINGVVLDPDNTAEVIGYRVRATAGVTRLVDREGNEVFLNEIPIETPLIDPIDFIPTPGSVAKTGVGILARIGVKSLGTKAAVKGMAVPLGIIMRMRGASSSLLSKGTKGLAVGGIKRLAGRTGASAYGRTCFIGLIRNRPLKELTHNEIYNAFRNTIYRPSSHAIKRRREVRTEALGMKTLADLEQLLNNGIIQESRGLISIQYGSLEAIINATSGIVVTISPL
jgi:hypothetical protein